MVTRVSGGQQSLADRTLSSNPGSREAMGTVLTVFGGTQPGIEHMTCHSEGGHCRTTELIPNPELGSREGKLPRVRDLHVDLHPVTGRDDLTSGHRSH